MSERPKSIVIDTPVTITVNGSVVTAQKGELLIDACERAGEYIPRFCYHPRMNPVGMCRMCLVDVDTGRGAALQPSCMLECAEGMVVDTQSPKVRKAQDGVLEFLLINHPLDCPVCDKGGECPLQDTTVSFGPGESRWVEEKRHYKKPIEISATVNLDRERCILCDRCTRFADEVAGDALIHFMDRGANTQVNTFPGEPFSSYFSGNTVQICPVGALTASPYRFKARPWDLTKVESTCTGCAVGCAITVESSRNEVLRYSGVDSDAVNWSWLCDKGRYGFEAIHHEARLGAPMVRSNDTLVEARWSDALNVAADAIRKGLAGGGPERFAVLGGANLTNESAYAWTKLVKGVIGSDHADSQLGDGLPAEVISALPRATIDSACRAGGTVLYLGPDPKEALGVLFIRLRHAVVEDGVTLIEMSSVPTGLQSLSAASLRYRPGTAAQVAEALMTGGDAPEGVDPTQFAKARQQIEATEALTVVLGRPSVAESADSIVQAAGVFARREGTRFLSALRRGNTQGAVDAGLAPAMLPGRVARAEGAAWFEKAWATVPRFDGADATGILTAAAEGKIDTLVLLGADPLSDFPDRELAERALIGARTLIAVDRFLTPSAARASVVLAAAGFAEVDGSTTNLEGRISLVRQKVTPPGVARPDWQIAAAIADRLGSDLGFDTTADIWAEIEELSVVHAGVTLAALHSPEAVDGIVVPLPLPLPMPEAAADSDADSAAELEAGTEDAAPADATTDDAADAEPQDTVEADTVDVDLVEAPEMVRFVAVAVQEPPAVDAYSLRLVVTRSMYDMGTSLQHCHSSAGLAGTAVLRLHPLDFETAGISSEGRVKVLNGARSIVVRAAADAKIPRGVAALSHAPRDADVNRLVDVTSPVTDVRLEAL